MTCWSTSSVAINAVSTADTFVDAEELVDSGSPSPSPLSPTDEFVNNVSIAYTADDDEEDETFADAPSTSISDEEDEFATKARVFSAPDGDDELVDESHPTLGASSLGVE